MKVLILLVLFSISQQEHSVRIIDCNKYPIEHWRILILDSEGSDKIFKSTPDGIISLNDADYEQYKNRIVTIFFDDHGLIKKKCKVPEKLSLDNLTLGELMSRSEYRLERK
ncbi:MAG: hypothetical protein AB7O48_10675 [Cyclobacteriaceae bacterium]